MRRIGVICHVFYPELLTEVEQALRNLPDGSDVYVSVTNGEHRVAVLDALGALPLGMLEVRVVPNRGRDIAPKYVTFADVYRAGYDAVLFLHTKKTTAVEIGEHWRGHLYTALAGSPERVLKVLELLDHQRDLGIVAPQHHGSINSNVGWHGSFPQAASLARRAGLRLRRWDPPNFASGSMFWARPEALLPLVDLRLGMDDFPHEAGQNAYTVMHALERLVFVSAAHIGYRSVMLDDEPLAPGPAPSNERPDLRMWLGALPPTVVEIVTETTKRREKFRPVRIRRWLRAQLRPTAISRG